MWRLKGKPIEQILSRYQNNAVPPKPQKTLGRKDRSLTSTYKHTVFLFKNNPPAEFRFVVFLVCSGSGLEGSLFRLLPIAAGDIGGAKV